MAKLKCIQIKIINNHFASQCGFIVVNSHVVITLHMLMFQSAYKGSVFIFDDFRIAYSFILVKCLLMAKQNEEKWAGKENRPEKKVVWIIEWFYFLLKHYLILKKKTREGGYTIFALQQRGVEKWEARGGGCHRDWGFHPQLHTGCYASELHWKHWMVPLYSFSKVVGYEIQSEVFLMSVLSLSCSSSQETRSTVCR